MIFVFVENVKKNIKTNNFFIILYGTFLYKKHYIV